MIVNGQRDEEASPAWPETADAFADRITVRYGCRIFSMESSDKVIERYGAIIKRVSNRRNDLVSES